MTIVEFFVIVEFTAPGDDYDDGIPSRQGHFWEKIDEIWFTLMDIYLSMPGKPVFELPTWSFVDPKPVKLGESYIPVYLAPSLVVWLHK